MHLRSSLTRPPSLYSEAGRMFRAIAFLGLVLLNRLLLFHPLHPL